MKHGLPGTWQGPTTVIRTRRRHLAHVHCCINTYPQPGDMPARETAETIGRNARAANDAVRGIQGASSKRVAALGEKARRSSAGKWFLDAKAGAALGKAAVKASLADSGTEDDKAAGGTNGKNTGKLLRAGRRFVGAAVAGVSAATKGAGGTTKPPATRKPRTSPAADPPSGDAKKSARERATAFRNRISFTAGQEAIGKSGRLAKKKAGEAIHRRKLAAKTSSTAGAGPTRGRSTTATSSEAVGGARRGRSSRGGRRSSRHHEDGPSYPPNALRPGQRQWTYEE